MSSAEIQPRGPENRVILVGNPNVGKSVIFGFLTGRYVTVSNYPGTTVEVSRGEARERGKSVEVVDTPLPPIFFRKSSSSLSEMGAFLIRS